MTYLGFFKPKSAIQALAPISLDLDHLIATACKMSVQKQKACPGYRSRLFSF
jgi:hypothetical protein